MSSGIMLAGEPMGLFIAQTQGPLESVTDYSMAVAGAEFNVAVGMSRLGHRVGYLTKLGDDPFGKLIVSIMNKSGISTELTSFSGERPTGFMLKSKVTQGDPEIFYFRKGSAASTLCAQDVERVDFTGYSTLHMTGILPALTPSTREATYALVRKARAHGLLVSFDPNLRPQLWPDETAMITFMNEIAGLCDIYLPGVAEGKLLCGCEKPKDIARTYREKGANIVVVKCGGQGAYYSGPDDEGMCPGFPVEHIVDTVGAGDGFAAGLLSALMEGLPLREAVRRANAVGAIQVMSRGDNDGLPTRAELINFMDGRKDWRE